MHLKNLLTRAHGAGRTVLIYSCRQSSSSADEIRTVGRRFSHQEVALARCAVNLPSVSVTSWFADMISNASLDSLSKTTINRSKRMFLDTIGVGFIGSRTEISRTMKQWAKTYGGVIDAKPGSSSYNSVIWGSNDVKAAPAIAAFLNGISVHSMDFDDTWHPATHPSGPVIPVLTALADNMDGPNDPRTDDILVAYNVGLQVQALLLRCSDNARNIPDRFHPPAVVGVMGGAAAAARLLNFGPNKTRHALAIAASFAGAPMGNAGTKTKPLHVGKAARFGLEAALMADHGMEGNAEILDIASGYGAFYDDYNPEEFLMKYGNDKEFVLHKQDVAIKRFPAHLGMHFGIDATLDMRDAICEVGQQVNPDDISNIVIVAPKSKYINRPLPSSAHEARHSFQFNVCSALLDGLVTPESFEAHMRNRLPLKDLLQKTDIITADDNSASFETMYIEVIVTTADGTCYRGHCDTPYGHWRHPLLQEDLEAKFRKNTTMFSEDVVNNIIKEVQELDKPKPASAILDLIRL